MELRDSQNPGIVATNSTMAIHYNFSAKPWLYDGENPWVFVTLPKNISDEIRTLTGPVKKHFGSVRVSVKVNNVSWNTSVFPDAMKKTYLLPVKKEIRNKAQINLGEAYNFSIELTEI